MRMLLGELVAPKCDPATCRERLAVDKNKDESGMIHSTDALDLVMEARGIWDNVIGPFAEKYQMNSQQALKMVVKCSGAPLRTLPKKTFNPSQDVLLPTLSKPSQSEAVRATRTAKKVVQSSGKRKHKEVTEEVFRAIRSEYLFGAITKAALGRKYGHGSSTIGGILERRSEKYKRFKDAPDVTQKAIDTKRRHNSRPTTKARAGLAKKRAAARQTGYRRRLPGFDPR